LNSNAKIGRYNILSLLPFFLSCTCLGVLCGADALLAGCILFEALLRYRFHLIIWVARHTSLSGLIESGGYHGQRGLVVLLALALSYLGRGLAIPILSISGGNRRLHCGVYGRRHLVKAGLLLFDGVLLLLLVVALGYVRVVDVLALDLVVGDLNPLGVGIIGGFLIALLLNSLETLRLTVDVISGYRGLVNVCLLFVCGKKLIDWE
jgi:hypothetical protein